MARHGDSPPPPPHPLEIRQFEYGWSVVCFGGDGHVRHLATADSEIQAFRLGHRLVHTYRLSGEALVRPLGRKPFRLDVERLMHHDDGR